MSSAPVTDPAGASKPSFDVEKGESGGNVTVLREHDASSSNGGLQRGLKSRHLQMLALGGTIGTGLFVGAGGALATGGPLGILLGYSIMGFAVYSMMIALGEMCTLFPVAGAFTHFATRFVDPALGFALGWNYWESYAISIPTEITAASLVIDFWAGGRDIHPAVFTSVFLVCTCSFNFLGVRAFGEAEFWLSVVKITTILGLIILGIVISAGGGPTHEAIGFRYWNNPGPFQQENGIPGALGRFLSFWTVFLQAGYSYLGTEIIALAVGETANPRRNVPKAIRRVFYRILTFYVLGVFVMGIIVSPNDERLLNNAGTSSSPWVIAIKDAGIGGLPSVINVVVLLSAFSAGNSYLYASSRTLYGLACDGKAPAIFRRCTKNGLPIYCLGITSLFGLLSYLNVSNNGGKVFNWLASLSSVTGLITWACILLSYIRFYHACKVQGIDRNTFPYKAPLQPYASYIGLTLISLVIIFNGYTLFLAGRWNTESFIISYISVTIFPVFYLFWKFFKGTRIVRLSEMDFDTGRRELDEMSEMEAAKASEATTWYGKAWAAIM